MIYLSTIIFTGVFSLIETINHTFLGDSLERILGYVPLYQEGVGWIIPAIFGVIVGAILHKLKEQTIAKN
jgi:LIVCS family branched-chain amino acid:cation transporter